MESLNQKILNKKKVYESTRKGEIKLAQIADNSSYRESLRQTKVRKSGRGSAAANREKYAIPKYKIRILGEHDKSIPSQVLPWANPIIKAANPAVSTGNDHLLRNTWVYVYQDLDSGEYFIDRVSPNTVCEVDPKESGFQPGDTFLLVPDTMFKQGEGIPDCAEVFNTQVESEFYVKQNETNTEAILSFPTWCASKDGGNVGAALEVNIENSKKASERLNESFQFLRDWKTAVDDASKNIVGVGDTNTFWQALRQNQVTLTSFSNTIGQYRTSLINSSQWVSDQLVILFRNLKQKFMRQFNAAGNLIKSLFPNSARFITNEYWDIGVKAIACVWNAIIRALPGLVDRALSAFLSKIVNAATCLIENFISGFLGQLLGQISALITGVFNNIISALGKISGLIDSAIDFIDAIGNVLDNIMSILKCEFECFAGEKNVVRYSILEGAKPQSVTLDFNSIWEKAKTVAEKFRDVTDIPEDISTYDWSLDFSDLLEDVLDVECNSGPIFCGTPSVTFWGTNGSGAQGNAVVSTDGSLLGIDIILPGQYESSPLLDIEDNCGNGNGGSGTVIIGPVTGIGTVGVGTTGGIDGDLGDLDDDGMIGGQFGQGTTAGIGITYHVTVNAVAVGNRFFIDDKQQKTLTFERGNTYILNQEHVSNNGHPLRFSETKDGAWVSGGKEYTRGVTIDGIPGLGKSATDTAYSRIVVDSNTPERLYYYCQNHKKMGGVINVITPETTLSTVGRDATVQVDTVNPNGGVVSLTNLIGGTGYNECMANVPTDGGSGTGLTLEVVKTNGGSIEGISINNKGSQYQVGDIVTLTSRLAKPIVRPTTLGVTKVLIDESGYGYLSAPDGSLGGMRRTWANRCQTIVRRKNLDWDAPYSEGEVFTLYSGDWVELPGQPRVYIDDDFDASKLPGAQISGLSTYVPQSMVNFPISSKKGKKSINFEFTTSTLIDSFAPDGLYDWQGNGPTGVARTDALSPEVNSAVADWNFYLNGEYLGEFKQNSFSEVPQIIKDDVEYRVGTLRNYTPPDPYADQIPWVRTADVLRPSNWVLSDSQGWAPFLKNYGVYPATTDPQYGVYGTMTATWRVATYTPGIYTFEMQADNVGTIYMDGQKLGSTQPYAGHNRFTVFNFQTANLEPQIHEIKVEIENYVHRDGIIRPFETNPAAVAWVLKDPYGAIIKTSLDQYGVEDFADIVYGYDSYYSIKGYNISKKDDTIEDEWFDCDTDYQNAKLLGYSDCDIRHFLENNPDINLDACMKGKLDDPNWGQCNGDLMVSITAPGCPKDPCIPNNTYPVIVSLDEIIVQNPGFGFDPCKDTVKIEPSNGAKAKIEESQNGEILRVVVTNGGAGFTELPEISINTETGYNAILKPIMKFHSPEEIEAPKGTNIIQVIDCVGKVS